MQPDAGTIPDPAPRPAEGITTRVRALLPTLTPSERALADVVLADPAGAAACTITDIAGRSGTSRSTVTRFCRSLGLPGYAELRLALAAESGRAGGRNWAEGVGAEISPHDSMATVLERVARVDALVIEETAAQLDTAALTAAVAAVAAARRIDLYAVSGSRAPALDLQLRLHRIGRTCFLWNDVHEALASAALLGGADVAVGISHSGETREVVEPLGQARANGATTVAVTNFPRSTLAGEAAVTLLTTGRETAYRSGGMAARHAQMVVLDCLYIGVAQRHHHRTEQALEATRRAVEPHRCR